MEHPIKIMALLISCVSLATAAGFGVGTAGGLKGRVGSERAVGDTAALRVAG